MAKGNEIVMYLRAENKDLKAKLEEASKSLEGLKNKTEKSSSGMVAAFGRIGRLLEAYFGARQLGQFARFAGELDSVTASFHSLAAGAEGGAQALLSSMREASAGTMSNLDMMRNANLAIQLMGEQVIQHLPQMARVARAAAQAQGKDVSEMMQSLVVATGRQSVLVLDNLGISSATAAAHIESFARSLGTTRDQMTDAQKQQAFFYAAMRAGQDLIDRIGMSTLTFGEQLQVVKATTQNAAAAFTEGLIPGLYNAITAFDNTAIAGEGVTNMLHEMGRWISRAITGWAQLANFVMLFRSIGDQSSSLERAQLATQRLVEYQEQLNRKYGDWRRASAEELVIRTQLMNAANSASAATQGYLNTTIRLSSEIQSAYSRVETVHRRAATAVRRHTQELAAQRAEQNRLRDSLSDYYSYIGDEYTAEVRRLETWNNRLAEIFKNDTEKIEGIVLAFYMRLMDLDVKYDAFRRTLQKGWIDSFQSAYGSFEKATKEALKETLTGENGWDDWQKAMKDILRQLVVDLTYAIAKAMLLKAVTSAIGGPTAVGGGFFGGLVKGLFFEKGYIPEYSKGRIPVLAGGMMPADHFPAFIGTKEAVINAESTRANYGLLAAMNANPGVPFGEGDVNVNVVAQVDGEVLFNVNEKYRQRRALALGAQNYGSRSVYR